MILDFNKWSLNENENHYTSLISMITSAVENETDGFARYYSLVINTLDCSPSDIIFFNNIDSRYLEDADIEISDDDIIYSENYDYLSVVLYAVSHKNIKFLLSVVDRDNPSYDIDYGEFSGGEPSTNTTSVFTNIKNKNYELFKSADQPREDEYDKYKEEKMKNIDHVIENLLEKSLNSGSTLDVKLVEEIANFVIVLLKYEKDFLEKIENIIKSQYKMLKSAAFDILYKALPQPSQQNLRKYKMLNKYKNVI